MTGNATTGGRIISTTLDMLEISGPVLDGNNWTLVDTIYAPDAGEALRTRGCARSAAKPVGSRVPLEQPARLLSRAGRARDPLK